MTFGTDAKNDYGTITTKPKYYSLQRRTEEMSVHAYLPDHVICFIFILIFSFTLILSLLWYLIINHKPTTWMH
jgi:hypothetical protein